MGSKSKFTTLNSYFVKGLTDAIEVMKATVPLRMATDYSCLGITSDHDQHMPNFITCTGADGGGAHSVTVMIPGKYIVARQYLDMYFSSNVGVSSGYTT